MVVSLYTTGHTVSSGFYVTGHLWWCLYTIQDIQSVVVSMSYTLQGICGGVYTLTGHTVSSGFYVLHTTGH